MRSLETCPPGDPAPPYSLRGLSEGEGRGSQTQSWAGPQVGNAARWGRLGPPGPGRRPGRAGGAAAPAPRARRGPVPPAPVSPPRRFRASPAAGGPPRRAQGSGARQRWGSARVPPAGWNNNNNNNNNYYYYSHSADSSPLE